MVKTHGDFNFRHVTVFLSYGYLFTTQAIYTSSFIQLVAHRQEKKEMSL